LAPIAQAGTAAQVARAELRIYLDADVVGPGPLVVRAWRPGDRFMPLGMEHEKKLQDYFADARVPRAWRARLPVVVGPAHILWVATQRIDQRARLTPTTRHILALQCEPLG
jgi:tRNA(Ile)-lysidine synthase